MKVNVYQTVEVDDTQRVQIANVLDEKVSKRKATRDELKDFVWSHGSDWATDLANQFSDLTGEQAEPDVDEALAQDHEGDDEDDDFGDLI